MYVLALAELHALPISDPQIRRALVLACWSARVASRDRGGAGRTTHWAQVLGNTQNKERIAGINSRLGRLLITRFGARQARCCSAGRCRSASAPASGRSATRRWPNGDHVRAQGLRAAAENVSAPDRGRSTFTWSILTAMADYTLRVSEVEVERYPSWLSTRWNGRVSSWLTREWCLGLSSLTSVAGQRR